MMPALLVLLMLSQAGAPQLPAAAPAAGRLQVFLDCHYCFSDFLREETPFVDFVRDRTQATLHVIVTSVETGSGGREFVLTLTGLGPLDGRDSTLKVFTTAGEPDDLRRRRILTGLHLGLLPYIARDGVPEDLSLTVAMAKRIEGPIVREDPWNNWVFSLRGRGYFSGEESNTEREFSAEFGADRITPNWKMTFGVDIDQETEEFDLDDDEPVTVRRRERDFSWLIVKALGEHWSAGGRGEIRSSTFDNLDLRVIVAPAVEFNVFPYSAYQRRQLRAQYALGVLHQSYQEETLFGKLEETLPAHEISVVYDQRERWGSVEAEVEWFQYLHDLSKSRIEANGELSWRIVRGLSVSVDVRASRIRDQISLRRRGATPEEILLRLRDLRSGYEYGVSFGFTYTFGSIFSSIVNPRFGQ